MAAILNSAIMNFAILDSAILVFPLKLTHTCQDWFPPFAHKKTSVIHSDSTLWWQPSWFLPSRIQPICTKKLHSFILTQLDDGSHLEFCHLGFSQFAQKETSLIHSDSTWWWKPSWILPCRIQTLPSWIQTPCYLLSDSLKNTLTPPWLWLKLIQSDSNSFILT